MVGKSVEEVEEVGDFVVVEAEVSKVVVVDGFGVVGDAPTLWFEVAFVVEFQDLAQGFDRAVVKIRCSDFDVAKAWCSKFSEVVRISGDSEEAGVFLADGRGSKIVIAEVREEWLIPVLRFEEVTVSAVAGVFIDIESSFL